ncbi:hypothetical protein C8R44DRAFT_242188 [Mycena epipterygia]|nr:hypothetical protein C8R44DRAFT_242188 [Mycena epipterygia]
MSWWISISPASVVGLVECVLRAHFDSCERLRGSTPWAIRSLPLWPAMYARCGPCCRVSTSVVHSRPTACAHRGLRSQCLHCSRQWLQLHICGADGGRRELGDPDSSFSGPMPLKRMPDTHFT